MTKQIKADLDQVVEVMMRVIVNGESGYINNLVGQYEEDFLQLIRHALEQFVVEEEDTASLRTELERVRGAVAICESLANVRHLANPKDNPYTSSIIERAKQWRTEGGGDGK
jgi:hypothetical protein